jgi:hypothetical protein
MIDSVIETYQEGQAPEQLKKQKAQILEERDILQEKCNPIVEILEQDDVREVSGFDYFPMKSPPQF